MGCRRALRPEIDSVRVGCNLLYDRSHGADREKKPKKSGCRLEVVSSGPSLGKLLRGLVWYASGGEAARAA